MLFSNIISIIFSFPLSLSHSDSKPKPHGRPLQLSSLPSHPHHHNHTQIPHGEDSYSTRPIDLELTGRSGHWNQKLGRRRWRSGTRRHETILFPWSSSWAVSPSPPWSNPGRTRDTSNSGQDPGPIFSPASRSRSVSSHSFGINVVGLRRPPEEQFNYLKLLCWRWKRDNKSIICKFR
jgi:hypothetical protein